MAKVYEPPTATHFNGNLLCAIDVGTSGLKVGFHDIIEIAIIPLKPDYTVNKTIPPFATKLQPKRQHNWPKDLKASKRTLEAAEREGMEPWIAVDLFDEWFKKLNLAFDKRIVPLGHNYASFDRDWIHDWLGGPESYQHYFSSQIRDTMSFALSINDSFDWQGREIPFAKHDLLWLCRQLGVAHFNPHESIPDALAAAECYRKMLLQFRIL